MDNFAFLTLKSVVKTGSEIAHSNAIRCPFVMVALCIHVRPRPHYAGGIWKRRFHSENASDVSVYFTPEGFKNATITGHFGFLFEENLVREITWLSRCHHFRKAPFSKCFPSTRKRKAGVFKFLRFEERFPKAPFSVWISVDGRPNRRNKAPFSNPSGVVWMLPSIWFISVELTFQTSVRLSFYCKHIGHSSLMSSHCVNEDCILFCFISL